MDLKLVHQPEHHFRLFDIFEEPKRSALSINDYEHIPLITLEEAIESLVIFIPQVKDMVKLVKEKCQHPKDNLSIDESASIMLYTIEWIPKEDSFYYILNRKLDSNDYLGLIPWYSYLKLILTSLSKLPTLSNRIFYRGMKSTSTGKHFLHQIFYWHAFVSCVSSIDILDKEELCFGRADQRTLFIIHSSQGKNISQHSFYQTENEILLPCGQQYQVVSTRVSKNNLRSIILKEFSDSIEPISSSGINQQIANSFDILLQRKLRNYAEYCEINLRNRNLTDDHMEIIVQHAMEKKQCTWLSLQHNYITCYGVSILANGLKMNESLESLYFSQNCISDVGIKHLAKILSYNCSYLTILTLDHNCIKDYGAQYLAEMLKTNRLLTDLWLSYNDIGDEGAQALANVLTSNNRTLAQLYLHGNKGICGSEIDSFAHMLEVNTTLNTLWLHDCSLSVDSKEKLERVVEYRDEDFDLNV